MPTVARGVRVCAARHPSVHGNHCAVAGMLGPVAGVPPSKRGKRTNGSLLPSSADTVSHRLGRRDHSPLVRRLRAIIFGDRQEIACIPHNGCRLEIGATAETTHPLVSLLLPGHVIRYNRSFFFRDRFELPNSATVGLDELVGFKLQLGPSAAPVRPPRSLSSTGHGTLKSPWQCMAPDRPISSCPH
jgi:hypothetical protein